MFPFQPTLPLRTLLRIDAATCAGMGAVLTAGAGALGGLTGLAPALLTAAGLSLFPIAAFMVFVATRAVVPPAGVGLVVAGNVLWVAGSLILLVPGVSGANELGIAFVLAQALIVAALAWFELVALRHGPQRNAARSAA